MNNSEKLKKIAKWGAIGAMVFMPLAAWLAMDSGPPPQLVKPLPAARVAEAQKTPVPEANVAKRTRFVTLDS